MDAFDHPEGRLILGAGNVVRASEAGRFAVDARDEQAGAGADEEGARRE